MRTSSQIAAAVLKVLAALVFVVGVVDIAVQALAGTMGVPEAVITVGVIVAIATGLFGVARLYERRLDGRP